MSPLSYFDRRGQRRPAGHGPSAWVIVPVAILCLIGTAAVEGGGASWIWRVLAVLFVGVTIVALVGLWVLILVACWRAIDDETSER